MSIIIQQPVKSTKTPYQEKPDYARNISIARRYLKEGLSYGKLGRMYKLSRQRISDIVKQYISLLEVNNESTK